MLYYSIFLTISSIKKDKEKLLFGPFMILIIVKCVCVKVTERSHFTNPHHPLVRQSLELLVDLFRFGFAILCPS